MLGNYKLRSDRGKLQARNSVPIHALHRQEMSISGSCLDLHLPPPHFSLFSCSFTCSVSLHPSPQLLLPSPLQWNVHLSSI